MIDQVSSQEETKVCVLSPKFWVCLALVNHLNQQRTPREAARHWMEALLYFLNKYWFFEEPIEK